MIRPRLSKQDRTDAARTLHKAMLSYSEAWDALRELENFYTGDLDNAESIISAMCSGLTTPELAAMDTDRNRPPSPKMLENFRDFCQQAERE